MFLVFVFDERLRDDGVESVCYYGSDWREDFNGGSRKQKI